MKLRALLAVGLAVLLCSTVAGPRAQAAQEPVVEGSIEDTAHAETGLPEHPAEDAAHAATGMPQLEVGDYAPQLVWLAITFTVLYLLMSRLALPRIAQTMEAREQKVKADLERAEQVKREADETLASYERAINEARSRAQADIKAAAAEMSAAAAQREAEFAATIAARTQEAERGIAAARSAAMSDLRRVATEVAGAAAAKAAGLELAPDQVQAAVDSVLAERA
jgi:F-type H+-transporting ATPase subunit b